jgi:hypothetical protein
MFTSEAGGYSVWDELDDNPRFHERNPKDTPTEPLEVGSIAPFDLLLPRPDLGPSASTLYLQGAWIPLRLIPKGANGLRIPVSNLPRR